jgi:hypothetical protein
LLVAMNCVTIGTVARAVWIAVLLATTRAIAQPTPPPPPEQTAADVLFEEGRALAKQKQYVEACDRFERSLALDRTVGTMLNLADCHEQLGHLRTAWVLFEEAAAKSAQSTDEKRTKFAHERADAVAGRLGTVVIKVAQPPPGLAITVAGHEVPVTGEIRDRVEPGTIEIVATAPGRARFVTTVSVAAGATSVVDVPLTTVETPPAGDGRRRTRVRIAWGLAGLGGATAVTAIVLTLKARNDYNATADGPNCDRVTGGIVCDAVGDAKISSSQGLADIGTVFAVASGVLLGASAAVYLTAPREPMTVAPMVGSHTLGLAVRGSF